MNLLSEWECRKCGFIERRPFGTPCTKCEPSFGRKNDQEKDPWHLLPLAAARAVVRVLSFGARKYSPENWRKVDNARDRYFSAAMRHLVAWREGERVDAESGESHLAHAACCIFFLLAIEEESAGAK